LDGWMDGWMFAYSSRAYKQICTKFYMLMLWDQEEMLEGSNLRKLSWVRVSVTVVTAARKLSTLEEQYQDRSCMFRRVDCRNRGHNLTDCPGFEFRWRWFR
jgi:hypothetical protein